MLEDGSDLGFDGGLQLAFYLVSEAWCPAMELDMDEGGGLVRHGPLTQLNGEPLRGKPSVFGHGYEHHAHPYPQ